MKFVLFTHNIADFSVREACRAAKAAGFAGRGSDAHDVRGRLVRLRNGPRSRRPVVALVGVKIVILQPLQRDTSGQQRFEWKFAPLADGMALLP